LDAPDVLDDFYCNLLDWSRDGGRIAISLAESTYIYSLAGKGDVVGQFDCDQTVTSCAWSPGGNHVAVGDMTGSLYVFDVETGTPVRVIDRIHDNRVGVLRWNPVTRCLTSGSRTGLIKDSDLRCPEAVNTWRIQHEAEVCGLQWRDDGLLLASGGNDNQLLIWDLRRADSACHSMAHRAAVKAIAWCPTRRDFLASGAGTADRRVRIWNTITGARVASCSTGAQVTGLTWAPDGTSELVASLGWSARLVGGLCALRWDRTGVSGLDVVARAWTPGGGGRILNLTSSPDRTRVVVTSPDEDMFFYKLYNAQSSAKKGAFANLRRDVRRWDNVFGGPVLR
jgi:cell division cycle protein 20 (cofactor of APC complex)